MTHRPEVSSSARREEEEEEREGLGARDAALGVPVPPACSKPYEGGRAVGGTCVGREVWDLVSGLGDVGDAEGAGAAEHHDVEQRVGAETVRAVHRGASGLTRGEQAVGSGQGGGALVRHWGGGGEREGLRPEEVLLARGVGR